MDDKPKLLNPRAGAIKLDEAPLSQVVVETPSSPVKFTSEEESALLAEASEHKVKGNQHFTAQPPDYDVAIECYNAALSVCPNYLGHERSVYQANIAACHIKQGKWKEAEEAATKSLKESDKLEKDDPNVNWKARLRRAKAREQIGTWSMLQDSLEDYKILAEVKDMPPIDAKSVKQALIRLPQSIEKKKEQEVGEMMGKLRALGDGILKPFGMSTDNFKMEKNDQGSYSVNFQQK